MATARKTAPTTSAARKPAAKPAAKPTAKAGAKPAAKPATKAATPPSAQPAKPPKADKPRKPKLVRDSFTIPKTEYGVLEALKARAAKAGAPSKKSEILRAGIKVLAELGDAAFAKAMSAVPAVKTGRPAKVA